ncbi:unnamed protein product [Pieris brassicae]|uniref:Uncharacterized protein n=1 Tax=Pieris brassicae TaxID=7116 RepID=A0A9P0TNJ1_PIEBR|nr:unnamed protein product [Pieris brassicae]
MSTSEATIKQSDDNQTITGTEFRQTSHVAPDAQLPRKTSNIDHEVCQKLSTYNLNSESNLLSYMYSTSFYTIRRTTLMTRKSTFKRSMCPKTVLICNENIGYEQ